jgi:predicted Zn-dependent peptidase
LPEVIEKVYAVTPAQILEVANEVFDENKMSRLIYKTAN